MCFCVFKKCPLHVWNEQQLWLPTVALWNSVTVLPPSQTHSIPSHASWSPVAAPDRWSCSVGWLRTGPGRGRPAVKGKQWRPKAVKDYWKCYCLIWHHLSNPSEEKPIWTPLSPTAVEWHGHTVPDWEFYVCPWITKSLTSFTPLFALLFCHWNL